MLIAALGSILNLSYVLLLVALFSMGLHSTFFGPVKYSILPQHLLKQGTGQWNGSRRGGHIRGDPSWHDCRRSIDRASKRRMAGQHRASGDRSCRVHGLSFISRAPAVASDLVLRLNPGPPTVETFSASREKRGPFLFPLSASRGSGSSAQRRLRSFRRPAKESGGNEHMVTLFLSVFTIGIAIGSMLTGRLSRHGLELWVCARGSRGSSRFFHSAFIYAAGRRRRSPYRLWNLSARSTAR